MTFALPSMQGPDPPRWQGKGLLSTQPMRLRNLPGAGGNVGVESRESQDFSPGVHAAGEAESYIKRPTAPRHFLPPELTITWDPVRQVVAEARVLPRLGYGQSRVGYQLSQALVLKLTDEDSLNGPEIEMAQRFPRLLAPILISGSMRIGLGPKGVPGAGLHLFRYHVQERRFLARHWLQENGANGLRVHSYLLATLATLLYLYACGVDAKDVGISNLSHRPLPAFIDANNWGPSQGRPEWTGFWRVVAKHCPHEVGYFRQVSRGPPRECFDQICNTLGPLGKKFAGCAPPRPKRLWKPVLLHWAHAVSRPLG